MPDDIDFLTKPALATGMLTRALHAGVPARWATGDEVYGNDPSLRAECEAQQIGYVLAIGCDRRVPTAAGPVRADALVAVLVLIGVRADLVRRARRTCVPNGALSHRAPRSGHYSARCRSHPRVA